MADKSIQMQRKKADGTFDTYYPLTKAGNVSLADVGGQIVATNVEEALSEIMDYVLLRDQTNLNKVYRLEVVDGQLYLRVVSE